MKKLLAAVLLFAFPAFGQIGGIGSSVGGTPSTLSSPTLSNPTITGTVSGPPAWASTQSLNTSGNAATVTTNANLTGPVTSSGNATTIASGNTYGAPTLSGHITTSGSTPGISNCGTAPSIVGNDTIMTVTVGTGG